MTPVHKIIHLDLDAFFASVEQRDNPALRGKAIAVSQGEVQGVVMTASYEARVFGVHSAMPSAQAQRLCPELLFVPPRLEVYREVSRVVRAIFGRYTDLVEPLSLDEAYLDVTEPKQGSSSATLTARAIKVDIRQETGLTASAGVSHMKFLAKVASGMNKPDGLTVIPPDRAEAFIAALPIEGFFGVGPATARRMKALGVFTGADLRRLRLEELTQHFGKHGGFFYRIARGIDERPVNPHREHKSISSERTFADVSDVRVLEGKLEPLAGDVAARLQRAGLVGRGVTLKLKYRSFTLRTRSLTYPGVVSHTGEILTLARTLLYKEPLEAPVRLIGVGVHHLEAAEGLVVQPPLPFPP